ncbi:MAG TPA: hypothetical protein VGS80_27430 [Ktedonobacterales bacterium]|nr:hypothetical protein [Ktedonobacterales bacterium]
MQYQQNQTNEDGRHEEKADHLRPGNPPAPFVSRHLAGLTDLLLMPRSAQ